MLAELEPQGVFARLVRVDHPFHHPLMQPASEELEEALADLEPQPDTVPFFSTVTGDRCPGETCDAGPLGPRRAAARAVCAGGECAGRIRRGCVAGNRRASRAGPFHSGMSGRAAAAKAPVFSSTRREREHESLLETAMDLHRAGVPLDFAAMTPSRRLLSLPAYAWDKSRWWNEASDWREGRLAPGGRGLLDIRLPRATPTWTARLDGRHMAFLKDHKVDSHVIFPAAGFVDMVLEAGVQLFEGRAFRGRRLRNPQTAHPARSRLGRASRAFLRPQRAHVRDPEPLRAGRGVVAACRRLDARRTHGIGLSHPRRWESRGDARHWSRWKSKASTAT